MGRGRRLCLDDVQRFWLYVHPSGPRYCLLILMVVYDAGAVSVCELFSIANNLYPFVALGSPDTVEYWCFYGSGEDVLVLLRVYYIFVYLLVLV